MLWATYGQLLAKYSMHDMSSLQFYLPERISSFLEPGIID